jgi:hypothetical protein
VRVIACRPASRTRVADRHVNIVADRRGPHPSGAILDAAACELVTAWR